MNNAAVSLDDERACSFGQFIDDDEWCHPFGITRICFQFPFRKHHHWKSIILYIIGPFNQIYAQTSLQRVTFRWESGANWRPMTLYASPHDQ